MIARIVSRRIDGKASRRAVLKALVHRQDYELAGAGQFAVIHQASEVAAHARIFAVVVAQDFSDALGHKFLGLPFGMFILVFFQSIARAQCAAPSSAASWLSETLTSTWLSTWFNRPLERNPRMKPPRSSIGKIFGAIPPPT